MITPERVCSIREKYIVKQKNSILRKNEEIEKYLDKDMNIVYKRIKKEASSGERRCYISANIISEKIFWFPEYFYEENLERLFFLVKDELIREGWVLEKVLRGEDTECYIIFPKGGM